MGVSQLEHPSIHDVCLHVVVVAQWICAGGEDPNELASWRIQGQPPSSEIRMDRQDMPIVKGICQK